MTYSDDRADVTEQADAVIARTPLATGGRLGGQSRQNIIQALAAAGLLATPGPTPAHNEIDRIKAVLDRHLPTIITGIYQQIDTLLDKDECDERQIAARAAYSAAHAIAKEVTTGRAADPVYDLPSVIDLLSEVRRLRKSAPALDRDTIFEHMYAAWRNYRYSVIDPAERHAPNGRDQDVYDREAADAMAVAALALIRGGAR